MKLVMENFRKFTENYEEHERNRIANLEGDIPLWSSFGGKMMPIAQLMSDGDELNGNYTEEEFAGWLEKYGLTPESPATWVTTNPLYAAGYENEMRPPDVDRYIEEQGEAAFEEEYGVEWIKKSPTFTRQSGTLVVESHDGDDGYLFAEDEA
jgi:hypothetical protein